MKLTILVLLSTFWSAQHASGPSESAATCGQRAGEPHVTHVPWLVRILDADDEFACFGVLVRRDHGQGYRVLMPTYCLQYVRTRRRMGSGYRTALFAEHFWTQLQLNRNVTDANSPLYSFSWNSAVFDRRLTSDPLIQPICLPDSDTNHVPFPGFTVTWSGMNAEVDEHDVPVIADHHNCASNGYNSALMFCVELDNELGSFNGAPYYHRLNGVYTVWGLYAFTVGDRFRAYYRTSVLVHTAILPAIGANVQVVMQQ